MSSDFDQIMNIMNIFNITIDNLISFINSNEEYKNKITKLAEDYNIESKSNFNIFTSLSDYYYRENLHSDILSFIFNPHTEKIGNSKYLKIFIEFIEEKINKKIKLDLNSINIERETNKIDILIRNCIFM